jgi:hypothetical protein
MKKYLALVAFLSGCPTPNPAPAPDASDAGTPVAPAVDTAAPAAAVGRKLTIKSECADDIWIQQQNHAGSPEVVKISKGGSTTYPIPDGGLASTRYWAKSGCDASGNNCKVGQSSPPCPPTGCAPPVDSKLEATWGCTLPKEQCTKTPQGDYIGNTFWNSSAVDGFTMPYTITVSESSDGCSDVTCAMLDQAQCPASEDLSQGLTQKFPADANVDLHVANGGGCFSPCMALTYPTFGGKGIQPPSADAAALYCCPTPPVSSEQCNAGPVVKTKYVDAVHKMCLDTAYGFAYDDAKGLRQCAPKVEVTMTFCPGVPAVAAPAAPAPVVPPMGG